MGLQKIKMLRLNLLFPKFAVYSLGAFGIIAGIIAFVLTVLFAPNITVTSTFGIIIFYIIFLVFRSLIKGLIINRMFTTTRKKV